jgi:hypothetical protein
LRFVYYETIKRKLNRRLIYECRWDERLEVKDEGSTPLTYWVVRGTGTIETLVPGKKILYVHSYIL